MSVAFSALLDLVRGITSMIERELSLEEGAAAEFRETHPDQEWQPQPGMNGQRGYYMKYNSKHNAMKCSDGCMRCIVVKFNAEINPT